MEKILVMSNICIGFFQHFVYFEVVDIVDGPIRMDDHVIKHDHISMLREDLFESLKIYEWLLAAKLEVGFQKNV